jgi:ABC-type Fe3+-hydroxamate transport system substrate-binding protein
VAATGTFIDDMLRQAGFTNAFTSLARYPEITPEQLAAAAPQRILLSSEPYPFGEKHLAEFQQICPAAKIEIVDGELFSWYGSRLLQSAAYFSQLR